MITEHRSTYKPFEYPWAFEYFKRQREMFWTPDEVSLADDVKDWNQKLTDGERNLLTQLFRFFTQGDIDVSEGYIDNYLPVFKKPELRMMLTAFADMEMTHIHAYSLLLETIGMPEIEYQAFREYEEMEAKHQYLMNTRAGGAEGTALDLAKFSAFGEGLQLFSSFAILLNFPRHNKMRGMGQIVAWSIRDESLHVEGMIKLFHAFIDDHPHLWTDAFKAQIYQCCRDMVNLEDRFIDLAFEQGPMEGLTPEEVKQYIRFIADRRLLQLKLKPNYGVSENPLPWIMPMISGQEHANFFEVRATEYAKVPLAGDWDAVYA